MKSLVYILFGVLLIGSVNAIGCEQYDEITVKCWNNGSIEPITYYNTLGQMWNFADNRQEWLTYEAGGFLDLDNRFTVPFEDASFYYENNSEYYSVWWEYEQQQGSKKMLINQTRTQHVNDDYVTIYTNITLVQGWHNWNNPINVYWLMKDIDVWNDGLTDGFMILNDSGSVIAWPLNSTGTYYDTPYLTINSISPQDGAVKWLFNTPQNVTLLDEGGVNNDVIFYQEIQPPFYNGQVLSLKYQWIDIDPCVILCGFGCTLQIGSLDSDPNGQTYNQSNYIYSACYLDVSLCFSDCSFNKCALRYDINTTGGRPATKSHITIPEENYYYPFNCYDGKCWKAIQGKIASGGTNYSYHNITAVDSGFSTTTCELTTVTNVSLSLASVTMRTPLKQKMVNRSYLYNSTLISPDDNVFTSGESINFEFNKGVEDESKYIQWIELYINNTLYSNTSSNSTDRSTWWSEVNIPLTNFTAVGVYEWDVIAYSPEDSAISWSSNGNFTFNISPVILITYTPSLFYYFLDRSF